MQARVRDGQARLVDHLAAVEQQVEVDRPWAPARAVAGAAELALDGEQLLEEPTRAERRLEACGGVEEARLAGEAPRLGLAYARDGLDADPRPCCQRGERRVEGRAPLAEVGAEADVRRDRSYPRSLCALVL
jgi:hypothetical protein